MKANFNNLNKRVITLYSRETLTKTLANVCDDLQRKRSNKELLFRIVAARKLERKQKNRPSCARLQRGKRLFFVPERLLRKLRLR